MPRAEGNTSPKRVRTCKVGHVAERQQVYVGEAVGGQRVVGGCPEVGSVSVRTSPTPSAGRGMSVVLRGTCLFRWVDSI